MSEKFLDEAMSFGLHGDFPGDEEKLQNVRNLGNKLLSSDCIFSCQEIVHVLETLPFRGRMEFAMQILRKCDQRESLLISLYKWCFEDCQHIFGNRSSMEVVEDASKTGGQHDDIYSLVDILVTQTESLSLVSVSIVEREQSSNNSVRGISTSNDPNDLNKRLGNLNSERYHILRLLIPLAKHCGDAGVAIMQNYLLYSSSNLFRSEFLREAVEFEEVSTDMMLRIYKHSSKKDRAV